MSAENFSMITKICKDCKEEKLLDEFWRNNQTRDGRYNRCKACSSVFRKKPYKEERRILKQTLLLSDSQMCNRCGEEKPKSEFDFRQSRNMYYTVCHGCLADWYRTRRHRFREEGLCLACKQPKECNDKQFCNSCNANYNRTSREQRRQAKIEAVDYLGGCCDQCGLVTDVADVYEFHHTSDDKEAELGTLLAKHRRISKEVITELKKCVVMCVNCHRILHRSKLKKSFYRTLIGEMKRMAIDYKGNICSKCKKIFEHLSVYDFHHRDPRKKQHTISSLLNSKPKWAILKPELDKCELLCANCHHIIHYELKQNQLKEIV